MATPIKDTPVLTGKDAIRFIEEANRILHAPKDIKERERIMRVYESCKHHLI